MDVTEKENKRLRLIAAAVTTIVTKNTMSKKYLVVGRYPIGAMQIMTS
jgi:hypothetical protein